MNKIIEIEELGFPKSLIIRENALVSELIDTNDLVKELNEQLRQYNVVGRNEQLKDLLEKLLENNMCSHAGDELIKEVLKGF